jgi:hypothetical protein
MAKRIEVRSQIEFDACVAGGNIAIVIGCRVVARENSTVVAWGNSTVVAWENSTVEARENSTVEARGNSTVEAWENSTVVARENSTVVAWENVFVRLFSALKIKASAYVTIVNHGAACSIEGGRRLEAAPEPITGAEWAEHWGLDPSTCDFAVPNLDAAILSGMESDQIKFDMSSWHGDETCNETNWCKTTHCRAGAAICLAGKAGFDLQKKYGFERAGEMIYAVSCPSDPIPDFHATNEDALADMKKRAGVE